MSFELFIGLVTVLSLVYVGISKFIQDKLTDKKAMTGMQAESKRLNDEFEAAKKRDDKARMDQIMKEQMEFLPKMNSVMFSQFKPMIVVLGVFLILTWGVGQIDPTVKDDIRLGMKDDGFGCDLKAGDGVFSACFELPADANIGKWQYSAKAINDGGGEIGHNSTYFLVGTDKVQNIYTDAPRGEAVSLSTDKAEYKTGDTVKLFASNPKAASMEAIMDNGTVFFVDLPFTIPILNVQRIYQPYWWFIFVSLVGNLGVSLVMAIRNKGKDSAGAKK